MAYQDITDALNNCIPVYEMGHHCIRDVASDRHIHGAQQRINRESAQAEDTYEVEHGLNAEELRILFKILAKQLPDCGRKRGAILRYIKAFQKEETKNIPKSLHKYLKTYET